MDVVVPDEFKRLFEQSEERPVVKIPDPVLRQKAAPLERVGKRHKLIGENMVKAMRKAHGIGLAAPQLGIAERIIVISPGGGKAIVMFNPEIIESSEALDTGEEGCLSMPGLYGDVERPAEVTVKCLDKKGSEVTYEMDGLAARVVQHEIDHLDGVLFIDKADPATLHWRMPDHEKD